ncbi:hypothetical protein [Arsukibacterium sp. MJ3]|uniref:hypothetical protein n=1 Tax=Arsukibacterium sp. MJ3 TaxID=1632859 RepID=UPI0009E48C43|nr:hypothetical protein [Arsukibacterium sp. MJ3]
MKVSILSLLVFLPVTVLGHSGGTDSNGCHAGSMPYHCHNTKSDSSSIDISAWDVSAGYQYHIRNTKLVPFLGISHGKSNHELNSSTGFNIGLKYQEGWYASYVSSSKSVQLGYGIFHISANSDDVGLGLRLPLGSKQNRKESSTYVSGSVLFSDAE